MYLPAKQELHSTSHIGERTALGTDFSIIFHIIIIIIIITALASTSCNLRGSSKWFVVMMIAIFVVVVAIARNKLLISTWWNPVRRLGYPPLATRHTTLLPFVTASTIRPTAVCAGQSTHDNDINKGAGGAGRRWKYYKRTFSSRTYGVP